MEDHGLRNSYSSSLSGLHSRIYQFQQLLSPLSPNLLSHFKSLGVEFAYLSQWFMTIFATTCPLDTLFRIYDVMLAEGANETIMRVALALILKNENKLLNMCELEDVLQLLLGRDIWEPYLGNPDQLIEEVTTLFCQVVTKPVMDKLHRQFLTQSEGAAAEKAVRALGFPSLHGSAFRLFDNWWAPKSTSLSPANLLRRTNSKQSLATLNSISGGSGADSLASTDSYASTAPTEVDRENERDSATPTKFHRSVRQEDRNLHEQVEGLLMALSEVQREAAQTAIDLQKEQERRNKAKDIVRDLVKIFHQKPAVDAYRHQRRTTLPSRLILDQTPAELKELRRRSNFVKSVTKSILSGGTLTLDEDAGLKNSLLELCALFDAEQSLAQEHDKPAGHSALLSQSDMEKQIIHLEDELANLRQRMVRERTKRHSRRNSELKEARLQSSDRSGTSDAPVRTRRELYLSRNKDDDRSVSPEAVKSPGPLSIAVPRTRPHQVASSPSSRSASPANPPRLRMIKTQDGRETPAPQKFGKRTSSLVSRSILATPEHQPPGDETLLVELVNAKTREATAIQERDEMKVQLDKARRMAEAREVEIRSQMESLQGVMAAQMQAHNVELERLKSFYSGTPFTPASLSPSPVGTPDASTPQANNKGWGWFGKGRSVSTSTASLNG